MLSEREYRIKCINRYLPTMQGRKIVIYGTGINAKLLIDHADKVINIIGLMDKNQTGKVLYGYKVLPQEELIALHADTIIIAAQIDSAIAVFSRIQSFCKDNHLDVYDLYGNRVVDLLDSIIEIDAKSTESSENNLINETIKDRIAAADVLSMDLKILFINNETDSKIFSRVWKSQFNFGTKAFVELRKKAETLQEKSFKNLNTVYEVLRSFLCLIPEETKSLLREELSLKRNDIRINKTTERVVKYALEHNKKLFFINESILPENFWTDVLLDHGIDSVLFTLINRAETRQNKFTGLYREILEHEPKGKHLHIGNDYEADGIAASVYGFQSIVIKGEENRTSDGECDLSLPIRKIQDYCTGSISYHFSDCIFAGYSRLSIADRYYVFICNEAEIKPAFLEQLFSTAENYSDALMICSRVSREDGTVIYAGEIINEDPVMQRAQMVSGFLPLYDYMREVGQISSVSFLVNKALWDEIEREAGTIKEAIKKYLKATNGGTILYQPLSEVITKQHDIDETEFFIENKRINRPKILVTDNLLTQFDHDAGSRCTWFYLRQFHKLGFDVTLMTQNFNEIQPYVMLIQQAGIRVIYGDYYRANWEKWLAEENDSYNYVYMQRPESSLFFLEEIRKYCQSAKIFYFAHDLHFLRLQREYAVTGNLDILKEAEKSKEQECALIETADVVHVVGSFEQQYLQQKYPDKKIRNIPLYIYEHKNNAQICNYDAKARRDILYVGSFGHPPNLDAVIWFAEKIFPDIVQKYPDMIWHVVGSNPPVEVQKHQGKNLVLHGFLSDEELRELYQTCRIVVVPLRYGAGVKGKIVEASYYQVPIVTTPIGAEGIPQDEGNMIVCDTAEAFSDAVCNLYSDEERLYAMSEGGRRLVEKYYSEAAVNEVLSLDMKELQQS